ncbi:hypothetical protein LZG00_13635 [Rhodobacteraceae bacterium LMO-12]|nr:hypothetical protein [Rhodobacteraceae bacterium LMO-JJ12]
MSDDGTQSLAPVQNLGKNSIGVGRFSAIVPNHLLEAEELFVVGGALALALIAGANISFGASARSMTTFWPELGVTIFYGAVALAGLLRNPLALPLGLAAYAVRGFLHHSFLHHKGVFGAPVPKGYILFWVVLRRFSSARSCISPCSLSPVRRVQ